MRKILLIFICMILGSTAIFASNKTSHYNFDSVLKDFGIDKGSVSVSIKELDTNKTVYELNSKVLMNPASVQKLLTLPAIVDTLGLDYKFTTQLYKKADGNYLIKLGADPYFTYKDLKNLMSGVERTITQIYIDDSVLDNKIWGEGWQWDDEMNVLMPKFSSYNLDSNLVKIKLVPDVDNFNTLIINDTNYPFTFFNNVKVDKITNVSISRDNLISSNTIKLDGTISHPTIKYITVTNPKQYFNFQLTKILEAKKIYLKNPYKISKYSSKDNCVKTLEHSIDNAINDVLKNSNNMITETLFKIAGAKHAGQETGTDKAGIIMFNDYCSKLKLDNSLIRITDGSGVSKNNLVSADFITNFLIINKNNEILKQLPHPGEGTLVNRVLPLRNYLQAKTGTLANISSIAGYLTSKTGKKYAFCIITNDVKLSENNKKILEDYLIKEAYLKL